MPWTALAAYLGSVVPVLVLPRPLPPAVSLTAIAVYVAGSAVAAAFLAAEARRRAGSPRVRLRLASAGTALMAAAFLVLAVGAAHRSAQPVTVVAGRGVALFAALAYLLAFTPPRLFRRMWSGGAAYTVSRRLLYAGGEEPAEATWQRYAATVRELAGADAVAVVGVADGTAVEFAVAGMPSGSLDGRGAADVEQLLAGAQPVGPTMQLRDPATPALATDYAERAGVRCVQAVAVPVPSRQPTALLLFTRYRTLFADDDARILAELGGQAAVLAERGQVRAAQLRLTEELEATVGALQLANVAKGEVLAAQQRLTEQLESSVAQLRLASQAKTDLLASMSHELRTPLNAIIGFSDLMRGEVAVNGRRLVPLEWVDNVLASGQHLLRLINDILDIAKVEAGRLDLDRQDVVLTQAVAEVAGTFRPLVERKRLRLDTRVPPLTISADPIRLRQILDNLVSNAVKFTPEDGEITVDAARDGEHHVVLSVTDSGVGIAEEDQQRIFEEFQQVGEAAARLGGTGLGLALVRRLVQAHGGTVEVQSSPGVGTRFTVRLPAAPNPRHRDEGGPPERSATPAGPPGGLLVIEDDTRAADLLRTYLETAGYQVTVAGSGESGLAVARASRPDAILLDVMLPGMDGWQVLRSIRHDPALHDVPAFVVTVIDERLAGLALGATDYFVKPVDPKRLLARLAEHVLTTTRAAAQPQVLIVDADPAWREFVSEELQRAGAQVTTAATASQALDLASGQTFHLIVTDLALPGNDGFNLVNALSADPAMHDTQVLIMTEHDVTDSDRRELAGKALGVLTKDHHACQQLRALLDRMARHPSVTVPAQPDAR
jgi:signal transduction histidine kinase/DNA-binding response OmpR family regulator